MVIGKDAETSSTWRKGDEKDGTPTSDCKLIDLFDGERVRDERKKLIISIRFVDDFVRLAQPSLPSLGALNKSRWQFTSMIQSK